MIVRIKDVFKSVAIMIISCCAVFVCTLFLNYMLDLKNIGEQINGEIQTKMYEAQIATSKVVCLLCGGCLLLTSAVMLMFYVRHYTDTHKKELGILKALGHSNFFIAKKFYIFGLSVALGTGVGFLGAYIFMPIFYRVQASGESVQINMPKITESFHLSLLFCLVIIPSIIFSLLSVVYALFKLKKSPLSLLKSAGATKFKPVKRVDKSDNTPFLKDMRKSTLRSRKILVFFCIFSSLCFACTTQMAFSMKKYSSAVMSIIIMLIGVVLSFTTLFLASHTVIEGNTKEIAMMKAFGYTDGDCRRAVTDGYRVWVYIGFFVGSIYQYLILNIMVNIVFAGISEDIPKYTFDYVAMLISLLAFIPVYELSIYLLSRKISKMKLSKIMAEE